MVIEQVSVNFNRSESWYVLYRKAASHDDEIQHLYEEMEQQIKNEKDRILLQVKYGNASF